MYNTLNNPSAHPSYSHYYLLSPSTLFFFFCTSCCFLHILLFFAHLIVLHFFLFHCTFYSYFSFFTICMPLCCVTLYNLYSYYFALSTERTWFDYISLLIIPCITYYVTNKETLNLEPWTEFKLYVNRVLNLQKRSAVCAVNADVAGALTGDGEAVSSPQHARRRVGLHITADVHRVSLPWVEDGLIGLELRRIWWRKNRDWAK